MSGTQLTCEDKLAAAQQALNASETRASFLLNEVSQCVMRELSAFRALEPDATLTMGSLPALAQARMAELKALRAKR